MKELVWEIFKKTGDIKYFLLAKKLEGGSDADKKTRGNNSEWNKL